MVTYKVKLDGQTHETKCSAHNSFAPALIQVMPEGFQGKADIINTETCQIETLKVQGNRIIHIEPGTKEYYS